MPAPTTPPAITALSTPPQTTDIANFDTRADTHVAEMQTMVPQLTAANVNVYNNSLIAYNSATSATASDASAAVSAGNASTSAGNAAASAASAASIATSMISTSTTSLVIGTGSQSFTTQAGKQFVAGQWIITASNAAPTSYMYGQVTSYSGTTLIINVTAIGGSGTKTDWNISVSGTQGAMGTTAATTMQTLTDAATVAWDQAAGRIGKVTIAGNRIIGAPTNLVTDTSILIVAQDATGSRVPTWNAIYKWSNGVVQNPDPAANRVTIYSCIYDGTNIHIGQFSYGSR